jgi:hypothetical protein
MGVQTTVKHRIRQVSDYAQYYIRPTVRTITKTCQEHLSLCRESKYLAVKKWCFNSYIILSHTYRKLRCIQYSAAGGWQSTIEHLTYLLTYGAEPFLRNSQLCSPSRTSPASYGTRRLNTVFIRALHWSLS